MLYIEPIPPRASLGNYEIKPFKPEPENALIVKLLTGHQAFKRQTTNLNNFDMFIPIHTMKEDETERQSTNVVNETLIPTSNICHCSPLNTDEPRMGSLYSVQIPKWRNNAKKQT